MKRTKPRPDGSGSGPVGKKWWGRRESFEGARGGGWDEGHAGWGRNRSMPVAVRHGKLRLVEVVKAVRGLRYQARSQAVKRFAVAPGKDAERRRFVSQPW